MDFSKLIPKPEFSGFLKYGTAGFRMKYAPILNYTVFVTGIVAALRSKELKGKPIGVMITASHNQKQDNGVKVVDFNGDMMNKEWEDVMIKLVNLTGPKQLETNILALCKQKNIDLSSKSVVYVGYDTRESSKPLFSTIKLTTSCFTEKSPHELRNIGICHTPIIHYLVYYLDRNPNSSKLPGRNDYYSLLAKSFDQLVKTAKLKTPISCTVDCACAVGSIVLSEFSEHVKNLITFKPFNTAENVQFLNDECGAEHIQKGKLVPRNYLYEYNSIASFDGDVDRLIFMYSKSDSSLCNVIEGDKISALFAKFLCDMLDRLGLGEKISLGVIQTAYANGASTKYLKSIMPAKQKQNVVCVKTGVKYLHHAAKGFDIGIYFESNGHGTIVFSDNFRTLMSEMKVATEISKYHNLLTAFMNLINPSVGDALSDLLAVTFVLGYYNLSMRDWDEKFYTDVPNILTKTKVKDRSVILMNSIETKVVEPKGMQVKIDQFVETLGDEFARCTVRPSGTEDIVRVYVEGSTVETCRKMVAVLFKIISEFL